MIIRDPKTFTGRVYDFLTRTWRYPDGSGLHDEILLERELNHPYLTLALSLERARP